MKINIARTLSEIKEAVNNTFSAGGTEPPYAVRPQNSSAETTSVIRPRQDAIASHERKREVLSNFSLYFCFLLSSAKYLAALLASTVAMLLMSGLLGVPLILSILLLNFIHLPVDSGTLRTAIDLATCLTVPFFMAMSSSILNEKFAQSKVWHRLNLAVLFLLYMPVALCLCSVFCASSSSLSKLSSIIGFLMIAPFAASVFLGCLLARRYVKIFRDTHRPILWLIVFSMTSSALLLVLLTKTAAVSTGIVLGLACTVPFALGFSSAIISKEADPLRAFKLSVSISAFASWGILIISVMCFLVSILEMISPANVVASILVGPIGLLMLVGLVGSGAATGAKVLSLRLRQVQPRLQQTD